jgi:hypothetical protein
MTDDELRHKLSTLLVKLDSWILSRFQSLTHHAKRIRISSTVLINLFILIQLSAQITQLVILYFSAENMLVAFLVSFPTWVFIIYLYRVRRYSRRGWIIRLDLIRLFALLFACLEIFTTVNSYISHTIFHYQHPEIHDEMSHTSSEIAYLIAWLAFPCVLYLLSTVDSPQKLLRKAKK